MNKTTSPGFGQKALMPFLSMLLFALLFAGFRFLLPVDTSAVTSEAILSVFRKWSVFVGAPLGLISMILMYIIRLFGLRKIRIGGAILLMIGFLPWLIFGYDLVYLEPRYASMAIAIINFLGQPMFYASAIMVGLGLIWLLVTLFTKSKGAGAFKLVLLLLTPLLLNGCLGDLMELSCILVPDPDHCYQSAAVQNADPSGCEKVEGKGFKESNPPRDKCYLTIANNTGDTRSCDKIEGGIMSYTKDECYGSSAENMEDPDLCLGAPDEAGCRSDFAKNNQNDCGSAYSFNASTQSCEIDKVPEKPRVVEAGKEDAVTTFTKGNSFYRPQGSNTWFPVTEDTKLMAGDTVRTDPGAKMRYILNGSGPNAGLHVVPGGSSVVIPDPNATVPAPPLHELTVKFLCSLSEKEEGGEICTATR